MFRRIYYDFLAAMNCDKTRQKKEDYVPDNAHRGMTEAAVYKMHITLMSAVL